MPGPTLTFLESAMAEETVETEEGDGCCTDLCSLPSKMEFNGRERRERNERGTRSIHSIRPAKKVWHWCEFPHSPLKSILSSLIWCPIDYLISSYMNIFLFICIATYHWGCSVGTYMYIFNLIPAWVTSSHSAFTFHPIFLPVVSFFAWSFCPKSMVVEISNTNFPPRSSHVLGNMFFVSFQLLGFFLHKLLLRFCTLGGGLRQDQICHSCYQLRSPTSSVHQNFGASPIPALRCELTLSLWRQQTFCNDWFDYFTLVPSLSASSSAMLLTVCFWSIVWQKGRYNDPFSCMFWICEEDLLAFLCIFAIISF